MRLEIKHKMSLSAIACEKQTILRKQFLSDTTWRRAERSKARGRVATQAPPRLAIPCFMRHNRRMKKEFAFQIEHDEEMLVAACHEPEMATQGENLDELLTMIRDLIRCRFDTGDERLAWPIRLHFLHDPVLPSQET